MKQIVQKLKSGRLEILEVPSPTLTDGNILVRTLYSLISTGTESTKIAIARKGLIGKAKAKPDQFKQVVESAKTDGIINTYHKVMNKLDALSPLGYSCSGEVIAVGQDANGFRVGDLVSCGGHAFHSEINSVPRNLCVKIPFKVNAKHGAFTTIGAVAMQGIRQADLHIGETCVVIGLGLVGQLVLQILKAAGVTVAGIDINEKKVEIGKKAGIDLCFNRRVQNLEDKLIEISDGYGVDAVIITADTSSIDPIDMAGKLCRKKGRIVVVGNVPTGFSRENYYKKELNLLMSCSYGPGRYDSNYEEKGIDYPIAYARWTENRNMLSFLRLVEKDKIKLDLLVSHVYNFEEATKAYELIMKKKETFLGVLLKYNSDKTPTKKIVIKNKNDKIESAVNIGFIGAGSFAQKALLPITKKYGNLVGVATLSGNNARNVAERYGFQFATSDYKEICCNDKINTVFIATQHNLHAKQVLECLKNDKNIFVEKPVCMTETELNQILSEYNRKNVKLMVGFNRRFSPFIIKVNRILRNEIKKAINIRINAGSISADNWIQDKSIGGGRIIGEVCHFIDLATHVAGAPITSLSGFKMDDYNELWDTLTINLKFANGSIAAISYYANGGRSMKKEYMEIFSNGISIVIDDYKELKIYAKKRKKIKLSCQDKGHLNEVKMFLDSVKNNKTEPIPFFEAYASTLATFKVVQSIRTGKVEKKLPVCIRKK